MLILICGLPATGKSTVSRQLTKKIKGEVLRTDIIRKKLIENPKYTVKEKNLIYRALFLITDYLLKQDVNVILDGTFYKDALRKEAARIAKKRGKKFFLIETRCPEDLVLKRLGKREQNLRSPSDADVSVYYKIKGLFEAISDDHIVIETGWNIKNSMKEVLEQIKA
jgi:predicted kinase